MPQATDAPTARPAHRYRVHARHAEAHRARVVEETSFEAAAVAYVEDFSPPVFPDEDLSVIVHDLESGREHCFRIDLETGEAAPCG